MSRTSATRSVCAVLLVAAVGLMLAAEARADLVIHLQFAGGATSESISSGSTTIAVQVYAYVTGNDTTYTNDGLESAIFGLYTQNNSLLSSGGFTTSGASMSSTWQASGYSLGTATNLGNTGTQTGSVWGNADGITDIGGTGTTSSTGWIYARNTGVVFSGSGTVVGGVTELYIGTWDFNVGALVSSPTGTDSITLTAMAPARAGSGASNAALWAQDSATQNYSSNTASSIKGNYTGSSITLTYQSLTAATTYALAAAAMAPKAIIVGGSAAVTVSIQNTGTTGDDTLNYTALGLGSLANLSITGTASGGTGLALGATGTSLLTVSSTTAGTYALTPTVGTATNSTASGSPTTGAPATDTLTVYGHTAPTFTVVSGGNQSIFVGGSFNAAGLTLANPGSTAAPLDVNTLSSGLSGATGTAVMAGGSSGAYTGSLSGVSAAGLNQSVTFTLNAGDQQTLSGASSLTQLSATVTGLNVYTHAAPSLTTGTSTPIGNVLGGAVVTETMTLLNAANPNGAGLEVTSLSAGLTGGATPGTVLAQGTSTSYTATVNTATASYSPGAFTITTSDDQGISGWQPQAAQTLTVTGTIGYATATSTSFTGTVLSAQVAANGTLAGLFSTSTGAGSVGTTATILNSNLLSDSTTATMTWRQATAAEKNPHSRNPIVSDVVQLGGVPEGLDYVLSMSFNPDALGIYPNVLALAANQRIYLVSDTGAGGAWENAVLGNTGPAGSLAGFYDESYANFLLANPEASLASQLGAWGVDTTTDVVWAVLNHASDFAVVPEPATMAFLLLGGIAMTTAAVKRRRRAGQ